MTKEEFKTKAKQFEKIFEFYPEYEINVLIMKEEYTIDFYTLIKVEKSIRDYDGEKCVYKNKPGYSIKMAVTEEYGEEAANLLEEMISLNN